MSAAPRLFELPGEPAGVADAPQAASRRRPGPQRVEPTPHAEGTQAPAANGSFLMTAEDLADALRVSQRGLRKMRAAGDVPLPNNHFGRSPRWRRDLIQRWIAAGCPKRRTKSGA